MKPAVDRNSILLAGLNKSMLGLEIGAGCKPLVSKKGGWNVKVVDHATQDMLRDKYRGHYQADIEQIEEVDIVWNSKALHNCVSLEQHHRFDYCIASHLVEHIPDLLTFFHSMEILLKPSGILSLAVPDKRFSFDAFKPISTTADILQAHTHRHLASRHSAKTVFENVAYNVTSGEARCWPQEPINELGIFSPFAETQEIFDSVVDDPSSPYSDCHAWYFTPSSFRLIITELRALGRTKFAVKELLPSQGAEFYVHMQLDSHTDAAKELPSNEQRLALMYAVLAEQAQQYDLIGKSLRQKLMSFLPESHPFPTLTLSEESFSEILKSCSQHARSLFRENRDMVRKNFRLK